jgi:nitrogen regulatory protein P-II 1
MKEITAIIQPHTLSRVMHALHALPHFPGLTLLDAHGQGRGRGAGGAFQPT